VRRQPFDPYPDAIRRLGRAGWLGIGWPGEYGGQSCTATEQLIFFDEAYWSLTHDVAADDWTFESSDR
jgi:alkylation response protein AidB-like acyl-CoA dehydrogenase